MIIDLPFQEYGREFECSFILTVTQFEYEEVKTIVSRFVFPNGSFTNGFGTTTK